MTTNNPYTRVTAEFTTSWNGGVITKPIVFNKLVQAYNPPNAIGILYEGAPQYDIQPGDTTHLRIWVFTLELLANTDANLEKMIEESIRILTAYTAASLKWKVARPSNFFQTFGLRSCIIECREEMVLGVSSW